MHNLEKIPERPGILILTDHSETVVAGAPGFGNEIEARVLVLGPEAPPLEADCDLILLDILSPQRAADLTRELAGRDPHPAVLALVAPGDEPAALAILEAGADDIVFRGPLGQPNALIPVLARRALSRRALDRERTLADRRLIRTAQDLQQREEELSLLTGMSQLFHSCANEKALLEIIDLYLPLLFPYAAGGLYLAELDGERLRVVHTWGEGLLSRGDFEMDACHALDPADPRPHSVRSLDDASLVCPHIETGPEKAFAAFCLPLLSGSERLGLLHLQASIQDIPAETPAASEAVGSLSEKTILARTVAENIALALSNIRLRRQLREQAIRDPLTGLFNRRYMEESFEREMSRTLRTNRPMGLLMVDIDFFKKFNDTYGHEAGDVVLSSLGRFARNNLRAEDIPCRLGGEEFVLILLDSTYDITLERGEAIRAGLERLILHYKDIRLPPVTASIGVAVFPDHGRTMQQVMEAADKALYRAKQQGRNRVVGQE